MRLLTDPAHPTRQGNSVQRDTTPDLSITHNIANSVWRNTGINLGTATTWLKPSFRTEHHSRAPVPTSWLTGTSSDHFLMSTYVTP
ncbi:hypothetical protein HPB48_008961 [Haemaphysalis longicornis]|uniref:Uncharacterized protein n=1 Tax=Haemaphysalis longicornis TaxID=44386 RepID=A0A9J6GMV8_HAELO|nr:hypothetical protein HPB48_008961 [Haemaphysalis longicornis]